MGWESEGVHTGNGKINDGKKMIEAGDIIRKGKTRKGT